MKINLKIKNKILFKDKTGEKINKYLEKFKKIKPQDYLNNITEIEWYKIENKCLTPFLKSLHYLFVLINYDFKSFSVMRVTYNIPLNNITNNLYFIYIALELYQVF